MKTNLSEIFRPTLTKLCVSVLVALAAHYYLVEQAIRQVAAENTSTIKDFWLTNFIDALPYLQTENKFLKFVTFFVGAYLLVWFFSSAFGLLDRAQVALIKKLRKRS